MGNEDIQTNHSNFCYKSHLSKCRVSTGKMLYYAVLLQPPLTEIVSKLFVSLFRKCFYRINKGCVMFAHMYPVIIGKLLWRDRKRLFHNGFFEVDCNFLVRRVRLFLHFNRFRINIPNKILVYR